MINSFSGKNAFLSNFYPVTIVHDGLTYQSVEAAYQAAKCASVDDRYFFTKMNASEAKRAGRHVALRSDWERVKVSVMRQLLIAKFLIPAFAQLLLETGDEELVEGNSWNDRFWGVCNGIGENVLGRLLMEIRDMLENRIIEVEMNEVEIKAATRGERLYAVENTVEICFKSAFIGVLAGSFDALGNPKVDDWKEFNPRKPSEKAPERESLYMALRGSVLNTEEAMKSFCEAHPDAMMSPVEYAFRIDSGDFAVIMRSNVAQEPGNTGASFHLYFYEKKWLDKHLENSKNGVTIRFYGPENKELHVPENGKITIVGSAGDDNALEYVVRYIDTSHFELQRNRYSQIYHVAEFADFVSRNGIAVKVTE